MSRAACCPRFSLADEPPAAPGEGKTGRSRLPGGTWHGYPVSLIRSTTGIPSGRRDLRTVAAVMHPHLGTRCLQGFNGACGRVRYYAPMERNASILLWSLERGRYKVIVAEATDTASGETAFAASARDVVGQLHVVSARSELGALAELAEQLRFDGIDSSVVLLAKAKPVKKHTQHESGRFASEPGSATKYPF